MEFEFTYTPEQILRMLEEVDFLDREDGSKRRDAYVTEWYFEKLLTGNLADPASQISTGWLYKDDWEKKIRHWVVIIDRTSYSDEERKANTDILSALHQTVQKDSRTTHMFHNISFDTEKIIITTLREKDNSWVQIQPNTNLINILDIERLTAALPRLLPPVSTHGGFAPIWLERMGPIYLRSLLLQRLVMNFALPGCLDIDAIELSGKKLIFHEFKRKTLCPNGHFPQNKIKSYDLSEKLKQCKKMKGEFTPQELFEFLQKEFKVIRAEDSKVFGLDLFHFKMLEFCHRCDITYRYSIWNSSDCQAQYRDHPALKDLFDPVTMKPKNGCSLISGSVKPADSKGFVFTGWGQSGSFHPKVLRIQATFDESKFATVNMVS